MIKFCSKITNIKFFFVVFLTCLVFTCPKNEAAFLEGQLFFSKSRAF